MVSIHTKIGLSLIGLALIVTILQGMQVPIPLTRSEKTVTPVDGSIPIDGGYNDIQLLHGMSHFFSISIRVSVHISTDTLQGFQGNMLLIYETTDGEVYGQVPYTNWGFYVSEGSTQEWRSCSLNSKYANHKFNLYLRISGDQSNPTIAKVDEIEVDVIYWFWFAVIPSFASISGIIILIGGFIYNRRPSIRRKKIQPVAWEPSLQWGGSQPKEPVKEKSPSRFKRPAFGTKAKTIPPPTTKGTSRPSGTQNACKYCGKPVSPGAYFCPHCYGKLK